MSPEDPNQTWGDKLTAFNTGMRERLGSAFAPVNKWVVRPAVATAREIGKAVMWAAFERENGETRYTDSGMPVFSAKRLAKVFAAAAAGIGVTAVGLQAAYFYGTGFTEIVYTTGKQEIQTGELYQFTGCTSLPCSTDRGNGKFYEIESSIIFPILFYPEEDVYAHIPQQDGACVAKGHGFYFRELRHLHRKFNWYQKVHNITCRPYTEEERKLAIGSGEVHVPDEIKPQ